MIDHAILPSEVQAREFDAKLLTACFLAERGLSAIVGARHHIHNRLARLPAHVYLAKDIASPSRRILNLMSEMGMQTALLDEEALIFPSTQGYLSRRVDPVAANLIDREAQHPDILALIARRREAYTAFLDLLPQIARAFPDHRLMIRPHPAETPSAWQPVVDAAPNCQIVSSGELVPWLSAAVATLHNGCTTGFESFLMGKVPISYRGMPQTPDDTLSPDLFSQILTQPDEVIAAIKARIEGKAPAPTQVQKSALARHVTASEGKLAAERLADDLASFPKLSDPLQLKGRIQTQLRGWEKALKGLVPSNKASARSNAHRYPGVSVAMMNEKLADFRRALGRFENVQATPLGHDIYRIQSKI